MPSLHEDMTITICRLYIEVKLYAAVATASDSLIRRASVHLFQEDSDEYKDIELFREMFEDAKDKLERGESLQNGHVSDDEDGSDCASSSSHTDRYVCRLIVFMGT